MNVRRAGRVELTRHITRLTAVCLVAGTAGLGLAQGAAAAPLPTSVSYLTLESEEGDPIGQGTSLFYRDNRESISRVGSVATNLTVKVVEEGRGGDPSRPPLVLFVLRPPAGQNLKVGTFEVVKSDPAPGQGSFDIALQRNGPVCNTSTGKVTIHQIEEYLNTGIDQVHLSYEQHCNGSPAALFGSLSVNVAPSGLAAVGPRRVNLPPRHRGEEHMPTVTVWNTRSDPFTVAAAQVSAGAEDFSVVNSDCATLAPSQACRIRLRFTPAASGARTGTLTLSDGGGTTLGTVALDGVSLPGVSSWTTFGQSGPEAHPFAAGLREFGTRSAVIRAAGTSASVQASVTSPTTNERFQVDLTAPVGATLVAGAQLSDPVDSDPSSVASPDLAFASSRGACVDDAMTAQIAELDFDDGGVLRALRLTFEHRCATGGGTAFGSIAWQAQERGAAVAGITGADPDPVTDLAARPEYNSATLTWNNPSTPDFAEAVVRAAAGTVPPATVDDGIAVYTGTRTSAVATDLDIVGPYSFAVFARDSEGRESPATTVTVPGVTVTMTRSKSTVNVGGKLVLSGRVRDALSQAGIPFASVQVYAREPRTQELLSVASTVTDADGGYAVVARPAVTYEYVAVVPGGEGTLGSDSSFTKVNAAMVGAVVPSKKKARLSTTFTFFASGGPNDNDRTIVFQQLVGGKWKTIARKLVNSDDVATFKVTPKKRGKYTYRVFKPADSQRVSGTSKPVTITVT